MKNIMSIPFARVGAVLTVLLLQASGVASNERLPWQSEPSTPGYAERGADDTYRPGVTYGNERRYVGAGDRYNENRDVYVPPADDGSGSDVYRPGDSYRGTQQPPAAGDRYRADPTPPPPSDYGYGEPYSAPPSREAPPPRAYRGEPYQQDYGARPAPPAEPVRSDYYEQGEIVSAGHRFFGSISQGLAKAVEYVFSKQGRPNGYILGEDAGGAFVLGLRYGEGRLHTKDAGLHRVYWQGPSVGYDAGAEGSKAMVLVYNMRDVADIYQRFGGVQGSLYVIGGVSVQFQKRGEVTLAVIRSGVGLRAGANVGYLKYTRTPTWNPL